MKSLVVVATLLVPSIAAAHIQLSYPPKRIADQKTRPCGAAGSTRGANVTVLEPGATIEVVWNETVPHPGHFRISFDPDGQDFSFPPDATSDTSLTDPLVLLDLIPDNQNTGEFRQMITLPDMECDNCTLQVIQLMTDKPPYTTDANSNDLYFQCADIKLERTGGGGDGGDDTPTDDGTTDDTADDTTDTTDDGTTPTDVDGGCSTGGASGLAGFALFGAVGLVAKRRRGLRRA